MNQKEDYANFCKDLYEKDSNPHRLWLNPTEEIIWFDEFTGELCLKLRKARRTIFEKPFGKKLNRIGLNFQRITFK